MRFEIDDLPVIFPYDYIYAEQRDYMTDLYKAIKEKGHGLLEMPSGTGKTIALLALIVSYQLSFPEKAGKLVYCTRTVGEMEKVMDELKFLIKFRIEFKEKHGESSEAEKKFLGVSLSSRKNLCLNPKVVQSELREGLMTGMNAAGELLSVSSVGLGVGINSEVRLNDGIVVDSLCRNLTADFVREREHEKVEEGLVNKENTGKKCGGGLCPFFEELDSHFEDEAILAPGVYSLANLKTIGQKNTWCPYFMARRAMESANVIVFSYTYIIDPKISSIVSKGFTSDTIVVFDEAHNIDNICLEVLSVNIKRKSFEAAKKNIRSIYNAFSEMKTTNQKRLQDEYNKLLEGMNKEEGGTEEDSKTKKKESFTEETNEILSNPVLPVDIVKEAIPGNMRKGEYFISLLEKIVDFLEKYMSPELIKAEMPKAFMQNFHEKTLIDPQTLKFASERLMIFFQTLQIFNIHEYKELRIIVDFMTLCGTYYDKDGFIVFNEPVDENAKPLSEPVLQFSCLDSSIAAQPVFSRFNTVIITSGTLSPLGMLPKLLKFQPKISKSFKMTLTRPCVLPLVVSRGSDQVPITSSYKQRKDPPVVRNLGVFVRDLCAIVPDGVIVFFVSYQHMEDTIAVWGKLGLLEQMRAHKLMFFETAQTLETAVALHHYRRACDLGRGALFFCIARGKVSEGIDFDGHYGRAVVMLGVPVLNTTSTILNYRLNYLKNNFGITDFLHFDACRTAAQCVGRVIRNKNDYGIMIFADQRYNRAEIRKKLPGWIANQMGLGSGRLNLSVDSALVQSQEFLYEMAQPYIQNSILISEDQLNSNKSGNSINMKKTSPEKANKNNSIQEQEEEKEIFVKKEEKEIIVKKEKIIEDDEPQQ